ncbi:hypothetical protein NLJ89_g2620 [Agrocybe chaxingu]|uniref:Uncharacterized protein n=1 Tax=Agrocybe chaxingu TaxID=84603 RepID=A0A9W8K694_9AGAR|nr:hypothetical protein NLJ89_g2620 [Agrocybe chaxingu]
MSLVLACFICFFIIGCLFWRRNLKKKRKDADVEARSRRRRHRSSPTEEEVREMEMEREIKTKQKIWARATARWRANVRYSAHQRRGKRLSTRLSQAQQSTASLDNSRSRLAGSASSTHSRASSRRSSMSSIRDQPHHDHPPATMASTSQENLSRAETPRPVRPASPPAYQRGQIPPIVVSSDESTQSGLSTPAHLDRSRRPSHSSLYPSSAVSDDSQKAEHLFSVPTPIHAAHVATDDKSLLARLADLASAPPEDTSANPAGTSEPQVSAPAWQDDEFEEYTPDADHDACTSDSQSSPPPLFPPPPSKERLAAAERYEYSFAFEELDSLGSEDEPSAPPFEEGCLPPIDESILLPSAPPLLDDDSGELPLNPIPSAPEWDSQTESLEPQEENVSGQDHDRMPSTSTNSPASGPTTSHPINEAVISERNGSTDTVMLPDYKP